MVRGATGQSGGGAVLRYGKAPRAVAVLVAAAAIGGLSLAADATEGEDRLYALLAAGGFLLAGAFLVAETFGVAHRLRPDGIERVTPWNRRVLLRWSEVTSLSWSDSLRSFELRSMRGDGLRLALQLQGLVAFARAALASLPPSVIDARPGVREQLGRLASGVPPEVAEPERFDGG